MEQPAHSIKAIICVGNVENRGEIIAAFENRLKLSLDQDFCEAINQIHEIPQLLLEALIANS